ncbi:MAG: carboxymuconolactone decarboxylase family protein [Actinomycetota bacterium]|nr:carboxymuconolactone decarboxylase family protein [Actinomycetota bacterium]
MARLPYVDPETASEEVRKTFDEVPFKLNIIRMAAHAETSIRPLLRLGQAILTAQQLDPVVRELAILLVARLTPAEYEWVQHEALARGIGVPDEQIDALRRADVEADVFDERHRLVLRFTAEVVRDGDASDATFAAVAEALSPRETVELTLAIGYYMMLARLMNVTRLDLDAPAGVTFEDLK